MEKCYTLYPWYYMLINIFKLAIITDDIGGVFVELKSFYKIFMLRNHR